MTPCPNCGRDSTALTGASFENEHGAITTYTLCSGCMAAIELTLIQRANDTYRVPVPDHRYRP